MTKIKIDNMIINVSHLTIKQFKELVALNSNKEITLIRKG